MNMKELQSIFTIGETVAVEFKRCGNGIENDTYETVCSFLNRFGGELFMGVLDDGTVVGVPEKAAPDMVKNFIKVVSNPVLFSPTTYLIPEIIKYDENHTIIHVHIPPSAEVHSYKKVIYDRVDDADVKVTATGAIAQMYIRKQNIFTEITAEMIRAWICTMCMITMIQKIFIMIMSMSLMIYRMQRITGKRTDDISIGRIKIRRVLCK